MVRLYTSEKSQKYLLKLFLSRFLVYFSS